MEVRQDWTRLTRSVHDFFLAFRLNTRSGTPHYDAVMLSKHRPRTVQYGLLRDSRLLADYEQKRSLALRNNVRNQLR